MHKTRDLEDRLINFAVRITQVVEDLPDSKLGNHVGGQLMRSGTSPAPNYGEAQSAESRKDFVHKMKVALKELRETLIWLRIIERKELCNPTMHCIVIGKERVCVATQFACEDGRFGASGGYCSSSG